MKCEKTKRHISDIEGKTMSRKLIIDGNAVYEIDEKCMLKKRLDIPEDEIKKENRKMKECEKKRKRTE